jgi:exopolyphosphatase / guanosine-5'-triphosphate,3'-diphosphate pyrophosphatase
LVQEQIVEPAHYAVLSVGTNSTRMLLVDMRLAIPRVEAARAIGTRIGEGLQQEGELRAGAIARTLEALGALRHEIAGRYDTLVAIATSALRRASNAAAFADEVRASIGAPLRILSGEEEARASFRGAVASAADAASSHGVIDVGGGSTEYALGTDCTPEIVRSYEIGAVRLTERVPELTGKTGSVSGRARTEAYRVAQTILAPMRELPHTDRVLCVGGSATTSAAILGGGTAREPATFSTDDLRLLLNRLCESDLEARKHIPGMRPQRADILPAGVIVLDVTLSSTGHPSATVATGDLLLGTLLQERDRIAGDEASRSDQ